MKHLWMMAACLGLGRAAWAADLSALAARVKPAVVVLEILDSTGKVKGNATGFFVSPDGLVVTNLHVVDQAGGLRGTRADGSTVEFAGVLSVDPASDLAIIKAEGQDFPTLPLGSSRMVSEGVEIVVLGTPLGLSWTLSEGIVSAIRADGIPDRLKATPAEEGRVLQITAPISPGSSGSPVLTLDGRVIGVARSKVMGGGNLSFATPVEAIARLLADTPLDREPQPFHRLPLRNLIISLVFFAALGLGYLGLRIRHRQRRATT